MHNYRPGYLQQGTIAQLLTDCCGSRSVQRTRNTPRPKIWGWNEIGNKLWSQPHAAYGDVVAYGDIVAWIYHLKSQRSDFFFHLCRATIDVYCTTTILMISQLHGGYILRPMPEAYNTYMYTAYYRVVPKYLPSEPKRTPKTMACRSLPRAIDQARNVRVRIRISSYTQPTSATEGVR